MKLIFGESGIVFKGFQRFFRRNLLNLLIPILHFMAKVFHFGKIKLVDREFLDLKNKLNMGDVLLTRTNWAITNVLIPGHYKHAMLYVGNGKCVEATYPRVREVSLLDVLSRVDEISCLRPAFANDAQCQEASDIMKSLIGKPYDFYFDPSNKAFYCSEAVWYSYKHADSSWGFVPRERLGVQTVTPQDFFLDTKDFKLVAKENL